MTAPGLASTADAAVQTNDSPLVSQYPANLLYAQGMLNTTMLQLQQVELQISRLRDYVYQHQDASSRRKKSVFGQEEEASDAIFAAAAALSNMRNVRHAADAVRDFQRREAERQEEAAMVADPDEALNRQMQQRMLPMFFKIGLLVIVGRTAALEWYVIVIGVFLFALWEYWMMLSVTRRNQANQANQGQGGQGNQGEAQGDRNRAQENRLPALRQRLSLLFKILLVMFLIELKWSWYVLYFLVSILFLGGMFDNWIEWFNGAAPNLENQLDALRRNGGAAAQPPQQPAQQPPAAEQAAQATPNEGEVPAEAWHCHWRKGETSKCDSLRVFSPNSKFRIGQRSQPDSPEVCCGFHDLLAGRILAAPACR
eukprot:Skav228462  [mRNA]  locus=scaffold1058:355034:357294:- [translate_table: standard]